MRGETRDARPVELPQKDEGRGGGPRSGRTSMRGLATPGSFRAVPDPAQVHRQRLARRSAALVVLLAASCAVGPDFEKPEVATPGAWVSASTEAAERPSVTTWEPPDIATWWTHFEDPVLSTMTAWSDVQLAAIIFHELSHQLLYVPGDSSFNESFASVVEGEGVRRWLLARQRARDLETYRDQQRRHGQFVDLLIDTRRRLDELYRSGLAPEEMQHGKDATFARLAEDHANARLLGAALERCPGVRLAPVETNMAVAVLEGRSAPDAVAALRENGVLATAMDSRTLRLTTHRDVSRDDCARAAAAIEATLGG